MSFNKPRGRPPKNKNTHMHTNFSGLTGLTNLTGIPITNNPPIVDVPTNVPTNVPIDIPNDNSRRDMDLSNEDDDMEKILQQIHDAELASAIDESSAFASACGYQDDDDLYQLRKAQEEADAELARQLAEQDNPPPNSTNAGDDINDVLEQIADAEAKEKLQKEGNAYRKPINVDNIFNREQLEEDKIIKQAQEELRIKQWREERERQDAEYLESERLDKLKSIQNVPAKPPIVNATSTVMPTTTPIATVPLATQSAAQTIVNTQEEEDVPKSRDELRRARLAFYLNKQTTMN